MRALVLSFVALSGCGLANAFAGGPDDQPVNIGVGEGEGERFTCVDDFSEEVTLFSEGSDVVFGFVGEGSCIHEVPFEGCDGSSVFSSYEAVNISHEEPFSLTVSIVAFYGDGFDGVLSAFEFGINPDNAEDGCITVNDDDGGLDRSRVTFDIPPNEIATVTVSGIEPGTAGSFELNIDAI